MSIVFGKDGFRVDLTDTDRASPWYVGYTYWGAAQIERESHVTDPEWERDSTNGVPVRSLTAYSFTFDEADQIVAAHNALRGFSVGNKAPWMRFDAEHDAKCLKNFKKELDALDRKSR